MSPSPRCAMQDVLKESTYCGAGDSQQGKYESKKREFQGGKHSFIVQESLASLDLPPRARKLAESEPGETWKKARDYHVIHGLVDVSA